LAQKVSALSLDQQQKLEKDAAKKEAKAEAKADAEAKKRQVRQSIDINASTHDPNIRLLITGSKGTFYDLNLVLQFNICRSLLGNNQEDCPKQKQARHCGPWAGTIWYVLLSSFARCTFRSTLP
jgi:hypothetical protein